MNDHNNISDKEIHNLLKKRLLEQKDDALMEAEAKLVFAAEPLIVPAVEKEKELIKKLAGKKTVWKFKKWILPGAIVIAILSVLLYHNLNKKNLGTALTEKNNAASKHRSNENILNNGVEGINDGDTVKNDFLKNIPKSLYRGQIVEKILKENADCTSPIVITDTIVFSPHTPTGYGNEKEIFDNPADDLLYFENEHNTVWYKFSAPITGQLTFDIIPVDKNDDYDFMLYKWTGGDFRSKVLNKKIKPIRTCISRNDKRINGMTGLALNASLPTYIHSGIGSSYVRHINVQKGETYYLLLDNVYNSGNGHTIRLHYKSIDSGELYVGKLMVLEHVTFKDSDDEFKPGSGYVESIDSLYKFLMDNPGVKIEIQGHVNASKNNTPTQIPGKAMHTDLQLSQLRANVVFKILAKKGIDPERIIPRGYAGTIKRIQNPKTIKECYINIRVEVLILSLDYKKEPEYIKKHKKEKAQAK